VARAPAAQVGERVARSAEDRQPPGDQAGVALAARVHQLGAGEAADGGAESEREDRSGVGGEARGAVPDTSALDAFVIDRLTERPEVAHVDTTVVYEHIRRPVLEPLGR
jgi:hypothetical protein